MRRIWPLLAVAVTGVLVGCGFLSVGERSIPSVPGAVAVTAWQSEEGNLPDLGDTSRLDPNELLARIAGRMA